MDISSLIPSDVLNTLKNQAVDNGVHTVLNTTDETKQKIKNLTLRRINVESEFVDNVQKINSNNNLTNEEKNLKIDLLFNNRRDELEIIDKDIEKYENEITKKATDPYKHIKDKETKLKKSLAKKDKQNKKDRQKSNKNRAKKIARNLSKTLGTILLGQITNKLIILVTQNSKLQKLVDELNVDIDAARTKEQIAIVKVKKDSAINLINNNEQKVLNIKSLIETLNKLILIFTLIFTVITAIFTYLKPRAPIVNKLNKLSALIASLNTIVAIVIPILDFIISNLEYLKSQIHNFNSILDGSLTAGDIKDLDIFKDQQFENYKGFKFKLEEENDAKHTVQGYKRHYAIAINKDGNTVLKSELSFTIDPYVLIDQLKNQIDYLNLQP